MTLLLGPPGSGKTTLLLALAGRLGKDLKVKKLRFQPFKDRKGGSNSMQFSDSKNQ